MKENAISVIRARTEERPVFLEFKKGDILGQHPTMENLNYDPFPNAKSSDVVRREAIGFEMVLHATLKGPSGSIGPGSTLAHEGHRFALVKIDEKVDLSSDDAIFEVEGTEPIQPFEKRLDVLAKLRKALAQN